MLVYQRLQAFSIGLTGYLNREHIENTENTSRTFHTG
nr:MAG TPA: DNA-directed RNA polymerase subunit beta' [Caudoviricetes sp.]